MTQDILMSHYEQPVASNDAARNQLQQFCILAKTAQGAAILELVRQVLEAPNIYVFAELIEMPNIAALKDGADVKYWNTLNLFAYGTHKQYRKNPSEFIELSPAMLKKLQQLTIVSLAIEAKCIPYDVLLAELEIDNVRHLEDVIIEAIYANIIHGKLFQNNRFLEVDYAQGRDIPPGFTSKIATTLQNWVDSCDTITNCIDEQIRRANAEKAKRLKNTEHVERTVQSLKKVLKNSQSETDDAMQVEEQRDHMSMSVDPRKKSLKTKQSQRPSSVAMKSPK